MIGRIIEIAEDNRFLSVDRGFLVVASGNTEIGRVALDDIAAVITHAHGLTFSNNIVVALAERNAPMIICAANHNPVAMLWPLEGNYEQSKRMDAQIAATRPMAKRLWAQIVKAKLTMQASVVQAVGENATPVSALIAQVHSGDPENIEAQAARRYWPIVFGKAFRRDRDAEGINAFLNYGYTVLRACTARAILAAGLHPGIGIHHCNAQNAMRLADDMMEPFRPLIDFSVRSLSEHEIVSLNKDSKRFLAQLMYLDMPAASGVSPLMVCVQALALSLSQIYLGERDELILPAPPSSLDLEAFRYKDE